MGHSGYLGVSDGDNKAASIVRATVRYKGISLCESSRAMAPRIELDAAELADGSLLGSRFGRRFGAGSTWGRGTSARRERLYPRGLPRATDQPGLARQALGRLFGWCNLGQIRRVFLNMDSPTS